jgi:UDP-galactopyranose mutase
MDRYQYMPARGYTELFNRLLDHPNIKIELETEFREVTKIKPRQGVVFTGPIDEFFGYRLGRLPYRSLRFEHVTMDQEWRQAVAVVNYPQTETYTRVTEYKHLTGQTHPKTSLTYEFPSEDGDPYYPIPRQQNSLLFKQYEQLTTKLSKVWFIGRLATYRYYNMDQVVGQALATFRRLNDQLGCKEVPDRWTRLPLSA